MLAGFALLLLWRGLGTAHAAPLQQAPANDNFADALVIFTPPYSNAQSTTLATTQAGDPVFPCIANSGTTNNGRGWHSVWYVYSSTVTGTLHVDTIGSDYDTVLGVWTGAWGSLTNVGCDDDSGGNWTSSLDAAVVSGTTYYIEIAGYYSSSSGNLVLSVSSTTPPANDDFANAFIISTTPYTYTQDTALATTAADDPSLSCGATGRQSHSVWYRLTASGTGRLYLDTNGSDYDTVLAVWTGSRGSLIQAACDDDSGPGLTSYVDMAVTAGTTYHIEAVSYDGNAGGSLALHSFFSVGKPLYLHHLTSPVTIVDGTSTTQIMDRRAVSGVTATVTFDTQPTYFYLYPGLASGLGLWGSINIPLYLDGDTQQNSSVTASLVDLAPGGSTTSIGSSTQSVPRNSHAWFIFTIPNVNYTVPQGHALRLSLITANANQDVTLEYDTATYNSRVELLATNFVTVEQVSSGSACRPSGEFFNPGQAMTVTARVADPFGSYDISGATLRVTGPGGTAIVPGLAMTPAVTATGAITYVYGYTFPTTATLGIYTAVVTGTEANNVRATRSATFIVQQPAAMTALLVAAPITVSLGEAITVTMAVTNGGQAQALNVAPPALTLGGTGSAVRVSGPVPTTVLTLAGGSVTTFTWVYTATGAGTVNWSGSTSGSDANSCALVSSPVVTSNNVNVVAPVLLNISKTDSPDPVVTGATLTYTVNYTNGGGVGLTGVVVTETYDSHVNFISASPSPSVGNNVWSIGALSAGASGRITITVAVNPDLAGGTLLTNTVRVSSNQTGPVTATETTLVTTLADLRIAKTDSPDPVATSTTLTYTLVYTNAGPSYARTVAITDTLPISVTFGGVVSAAPPIALSSTSPPAWTTPTLAAGAVGSIVFTVTVNPGASGLITNSVTITSTTPDPSPGNNRADAPTTVVALPALSLAKSDSPDPVCLGSNLVYTLTYANNGAGGATNVVITETYDSNVNFVSANPSPDQGNNVWLIGNLNAGGSGTAVITVTVNGGDVLVNRADIGCDQGVSSSAAEQTTVVVPGQITITKAVSPSIVDTPGLLVTHTYTITIYNGGTSTVTIQQITDTLPAGFTYSTTVAATGIDLPDVVSANGQNITWSYTPAPHDRQIDGGTSAALTFLATSSTSGGSFCNSAGVTIGGSLGIVARDNLACVTVSWPIYEIETEVHGLRIRARVRMENGQPVILSWEFLP